jgi:hypothetical protein
VEQYEVVLNVPGDTLTGTYTREGLREFLNNLELGDGDEVTIIRVDRPEEQRNG